MTTIVIIQRTCNENNSFDYKLIVETRDDINRPFSFAVFLYFYNISIDLATISLSPFQNPNISKHHIENRDTILGYTYLSLYKYFLAFRDVSAFWKVYGIATKN